MTQLPGNPEPRPHPPSSSPLSPKDTHAGAHPTSAFGTQHVAARTVVGAAGIRGAGETPAAQQGGQGVAGETEEDECAQGQAGAVQHAPAAGGQQLLGLHLVGVGRSARAAREWPRGDATGKEGSAPHPALLWDPRWLQALVFLSIKWGLWRLCQGPLPDLVLGLRY